MRNLKLIIHREYMARVKNKTFIIMTFLSPVILVGMFLLIGYLSMLNNSEVRTIGVIDQSGIFSGEFENNNEVLFLDLSALSLEQGRDLVREKDYYGLLYIPNVDNNMELARSIEIFSNEPPGLGVLQQIERTISEKLTTRELIQRGVDITQIESSEAQVNIQIQNFAGQRTSKMSSYIKMIFGGIAGYLLMMFIIVYGNMVMRSVIEEKTNRIIEIIVSSVKPLQLMLGKILGTSLAGLTQFAIWVVLGGILLFLTASLTGMDLMSGQPQAQQGLEELGSSEVQQLMIDVANLPLLTLLLSFLVYFLGGYFLYSAIYAAIGAAVDSETDTQQFMFPIILPLMLGIYVGFFSVIENPHGVVSTIFSMIPLTSPIVMLMRIPFGVPWWELGISIGLLIITNFGVLWLAAKIYRVGILMYGKKPTYKELYKWLRY
ncbi:ABC transporter permease [Antarcticibacterium flavum]|uniref:ABC transporter permease n=1 Tax=Antarcticibacterium flavum TaxID=2058175 RepID=A0A5B7X233_9FLAO|nr:MULTISPECIES: ABC transporter permease [Antarcticibacterium]MCM4160752.1 ABC transporter permease [Antarcticibacterium sp. W02-3]QCY68772.1 ABC transporter permease [Antarcticibacterium flavum]